MHVHRKFKPHLLLSNCCHVEYFDLALSLSPNSWLTKSRVLFVVLEGNLRSELTSIGSVHTVSRVGPEPQTGYGYDCENVKFSTDTVRAPARAPFSSYTCQALQDSHTHCLSMLSVIIVAICGRTKLVESRKLWST